ncbi:hypothetical protein ACHAW5_005295 [Stephanodiscus triporus]|uniref:Inositol polyphosphate-related phosphatase domain-containing protein n=1 Tax=Stephanodiscus triporus TaxID=2934178 RepID=A0ABD3MQ22_9STRA
MAVDAPDETMQGEDSVSMTRCASVLKKMVGSVEVALDDHPESNQGRMTEAVTEKERAIRGMDDDEAAMENSTASLAIEECWAGSGDDFVCYGNTEEGNATMETKEYEGTSLGANCQIDAFAKTADNLQPSRVDDLIQFTGDRIILEDIDAADEVEEGSRHSGSFDIDGGEDEGLGEEKEGDVEYASVNEKDVHQVRLTGITSFLSEAKVIDFAEIDEPITKASMEEESNAHSKILAKNDKENNSPNPHLDDDPHGLHPKDKRETDDENENTGNDESDAPLESLSTEPSADSNMNESDCIDDGAFEDDAVEETIPTPSIAAVKETHLKQVKDIKTQDERNSEQNDDNCVTLSVVTWNLGEAEPSEKEASFFRRFRKSDLVMIGAQECEEIKPRRTEGRRSRHLRRISIMMLGEKYVPLAIHSLGGIQCALYCHRDVLGDVEMIDLADVTCGVGGVFHNKGAIGIYLKLKRRSPDKNSTMISRILLVSGHLAAHVKNVDARNSDFKRIVSDLEAQAPARFLRPKRNTDGSLAECDGAHLLSSMDHVFFVGDLNYRIDLPREYVERCIVDVQQCRSKGTHSHANLLMKNLLRRDQLLQTIALGQAFSNFNEGEITFLPTFKFDKGTSNYDTSHKQRVPAWTDRIVFHSSKVSVLEYDSAAEAKHSDHRPVFGTFQLGWGMSGNLSRKSKTKQMRASQKRDQ